jgi:arylsulfatase A-like enzyme
MMTRRATLFSAVILFAAPVLSAEKDAAATRPNILFAIADDWGWPQAGAYGDPVVKTPAFDRIAREGLLFQNAFVSSPSCTPCRSAILTGQWHWRLDEAANLWSTLPAKFPVYPLLLEKAGYHIGYTRKAWGPGRNGVGGRTKDPAGPTFRNFAAFMGGRPKDKPFCFWLGASDPHRPYKLGSGAASGMKLADIRLPACFPDHKIVRGDVADYYYEVQRFDRDVAVALKLLEDAGQLDNTIVVMTGDHGMPFPRCKSNLYDSGTHVPLAIRWPKKIKAGRSVIDFVSLNDLAPTFLEAAGAKTPDAMTGRSLMNVFAAAGSGQIDPDRSYVLSGKERHVPAQEIGNTGGYPCRSIRTHDFLYIRNFKPDRWPAGVPTAATSHHGNLLADCDGGPTKTFINRGRTDPKIKPFYDLAFAKRPAEELYDLKKDPDQLTNIAGNESYAAIQKKLSAQLMADLKSTADPRVIGGADRFDRYPYYGGIRRRRPPSKRPPGKKQARGQ